MAWGAVCALIVPAMGQSEPASKPAADESLQPRPSIAGRRVVRRFDFDERRFGNYDPVPMRWKQGDQAGFPPYLEGKFDAGD